MSLLRPLNEIEDKLFAAIARIEMAKALLLPAGKLMHPGFPDIPAWQKQLMDLISAKGELVDAVLSLDDVIKAFSEVVKEKSG